MHITVKKAKLVLGRTVYRQGDVFDCRDAEAKLLIAGGMATKSPHGAKSTKASPTPPTTGISNKPGTPPASQETPASRAATHSKKTLDSDAPKAETESAPNSAETESASKAETKPKGKPVGAMTMTQGLASRPVSAITATTPAPATTPKA